MYYFAYGSNMNLEHMRRLCGWHFRVLGIAVLDNFEFGPDTRGYANIRQQQGQKVYGILYEVDQHCLAVLDEFEGVPEVFKREEVVVNDMEGDEYKTWVYLEGSDYFGNSEIKEDYLKRVLVGARENRLPEEWIKFLSGFEKK